MKSILLITLTSFFLFSCATTSRLETLEPGMKIGKVKSIMGSPDSTSFKNGAYVLKYSLLKPFHGQQPWYLVFNPKTKRLHSWYMNEGEFRRNQAEWNAAFAQINQQMENEKQRQHEKDMEYQKSIRSIGSQGTVNCVEKGTDYLGNKKYECTK